MIRVKQPETAERSKVIKRAQQASSS